MKLRLYILAFLTALLIGCTKEFDLDLENGENGQLVVEGYITDEVKAHQIRLTKSTDYYVNQAPVGVSGATVSITDGTNTYVLTEDSQEAGVYLTDPTVQGVEGRTYTLNITSEGENYEAISTMPYTVLMDSADIILDTIFTQFFDADTSKDYYRIRGSFQDPAGIENNYLWNLYKNDTLLSDTLYEVLFSNDEFYDGQFLPLDDIFYEDAESGDTFMIETLCIPEHVFDFYIDVNLETEWKGGIFDAPPANISTNISNGGLGIFYAAARTEYLIPVP